MRIIENTGGMTPKQLAEAEKRAEKSIKEYRKLAWSDKPSPTPRKSKQS